VAGHHTVVHLGWAHVDADHAGDLPATVGAAGARHPGAVTLPQAGHELAAQFASGLGIDGRVDGLVGHVAFRLVGEHAVECGGNLRRRPLFKLSIVSTTRHATPPMSSLAVGLAALRRWECKARAVSLV